MEVSAKALCDLVTIAMIPRDTFAWSNKVLDRLIETTPENVKIIVVDTGASANAKEYMEQRCKEAGVTLLRSHGAATSSQARNKAIELVSTKYLAFVDNDTLVSDGWLEPLVKCAEESAAWVVGPIICERLPEATWLHGYDGELEIRETPDGKRYYHDYHYNAHVKLADVRHQLKRMETPIVEFHAQLVAMEAFRHLGNYDENIVNMYDYGDFLLRVQGHGKKIMLEPDSLVTYLPPMGIPEEDREFFELRWCDARTDLTYESLAKRHKLDVDHPDWKRPHNYVRSQRMLGKSWLRKPRKILGRHKMRWLERKLLVPLDVFINRRKYPVSRYGKVGPATFERLC